MASTIRIKKRSSSGSAGAPSSLASSELAFNENASDKTLYYGYGDNGSGVATSIIKIGGPGAYCDLTTDQTVAGDKTFSENVVVTGNLTVNGTTTTLATTNSTVKDTLIELGNGVSGTPGNDAGIVIERGSSNNVFIGWDESADKFTLGEGSFTGASTGDLSITTGTLVANIEGNVTGNVTGNTSGSSGSCTGNAATATALANARTIGGTSFDGTSNIAVALSTEATNVTASANNSTDETVYPTFVDGATGTQGIETDTGLTYNPSTGVLTTTSVTGNLTGNVTGNVTGNTSGSSGSCTGNAAGLTGTPNITVGDVVAASLDISGNADIDGTLEADAYTVNGTALDEYIHDQVGLMVSDNTESGITVTYEDDDNTLDFVVGTLNQNTTGTAGGLTGTPNITVGDVVAASLDISGNADIDGTMEADAYTVDGTALNEYIADTVGAMVGSNTESGITVAYQDADNTLDFTVGTLNQDTTGTAAIATTVTVADESSDTTCFPLFSTAATGNLGPKSGSNLTFNSSSGDLTATLLNGGAGANLDLDFGSVA